ncbi:hypothetical protein LZ32DRAFT_28863 [Colletotrichum eremochloae]|nr:hypothetical protein LZ32DRAFT_28863 [Colletotrichum eremochloae]
MRTTRSSTISTISSVEKHSTSHAHYHFLIHRPYSLIHSLTISLPLTTKTTKNTWKRRKRRKKKTKEKRQNPTIDDSHKLAGCPRPIFDPTRTLDTHTKKNTGGPLVFLTRHGAHQPPPLPPRFSPPDSSDVRYDLTTRFLPLTGAADHVLRSSSPGCACVAGASCSFHVPEYTV